MAHYRSGHWRTSKNGNVHWVSEHSVQRDDFRRSSWSLSSEWYTRPVTTKEHLQQRPSGQLPQSAGASRALTRPNATCPVCGASVYFYSNSVGSKVYFDALGPPWPKHPCMDSRSVASPWEQIRSATSQVQPPPSPLAATGTTLDIGEDFHDQRRYQEGSVLDVRRRGRGTRLLLQFGGEHGPWGPWLSYDNMGIESGDAVFLGPASGQHEALSYLDRNYLAAIGIWVQRARTSHSDHRRARKRLSP